MTLDRRLLTADPWSRGNRLLLRAEELGGAADSTAAASAASATSAASASDISSWAVVRIDSRVERYIDWVPRGTDPRPRPNPTPTPTPTPAPTPTPNLHALLRHGASEEGHVRLKHAVAAPGWG